MQKQNVVIVAGGSGTRMGTATPKQFLLLKGMPVLMHTINRFYTYNQSIKIVLVLPLEQIRLWESLCEEHCFNINHTVIAGGETRFHSVQNGLSIVEDHGLVAIHDGVRPLVSLDTISRCFDTASRLGNAIPACKPVESVRLEQTNNTTQSFNRDKVWLVQTPQVFSVSTLKHCYKTKWQGAFTDDASVIESQGEFVNIVAGNPENIKITTPFDLTVAELIMNMKDTQY